MPLGKIEACDIIIKDNKFKLFVNILQTVPNYNILF